MERLTNYLLILFFIVLILITQGCGVANRFAIRHSVGPILDSGFDVFKSEPDYILAKESLAGNLKLIEILIQQDPKNEKLLLFASQGYSFYAFGFIEDEMEEASIKGKKEVAEFHKLRAKNFYLRGKEFALKVLKMRNPKVAEKLEGNINELTPLLQKIGKDDVPTLFWLAFSMASYINLSLDDITAVTQVEKIEALMNRIIELDENFFCGGPHLFLGIYYGSRRKELGGDPEKAEKHFKKVIELTQGKFLLAQMAYAQFYAYSSIFNQELFHNLLTEVVKTPASIWPEWQLANVIAQRRAKRLLAQENELF